MRNPASKRAWVLTGDGINCERESARACEKAGFRAEIFHVNDLIRDRASQDELARNASLLFLPGGFSFGDELGSGRVLALKLRRLLGWDLALYARRGGLVLGVCNGFQALIRMGAFGDDVSIAHNDSGRFVDRWVDVTVPEDSGAFWTRGLRRFPLPIRHGEGRVLFSDAARSPARRVALAYAEDVNGSTERIAGLTDATGRILGLMPHPEAFVRSTQGPAWTDRPGVEEDGAGLVFFRNAYEEASHL